MKRSRRILITGASSGIGQGIAVRLSSAESTIVSLDLLDGAATALRCAGSFHHVPLDVSDAGAVDAAFQRVEEAFDGEAPDLVVCCAALSRASPFLDVTLDDLDRMLAVNVRGTFLVCQRAARLMVPARSGHIVVVTSVCAFQGWARESVYCVTKGAQASLVQALAVELAPFGILVNGVAPGLIEKAGGSMAKTRDDPEIHQHDLDRTSVGRFGRVEEVAEAVAYLAGVTWMTGQNIALDGGFMATGLGYFGASRESLVSGR